MKLLFIGDVVGVAGQRALTRFLPLVKQHYKPQLTIVNGENIADGKGITAKLYKWLLANGCDVVTLGNHAWDNRDIFDFIEEAKCLVRPVNLPDATPGKGVHYIRLNQLEVAIINVLGNVYMNPAGNPFHTLPELVAQVRQRTPLIFVDFHAEVTSEKQALGYLLDGQVSAVVGTHTHVQTNDARVLPKGTAYLTDVGMTGCRDSILGFKVKDVLKRFASQLPTRLEQAVEGELLLSATLIELDNQTGQAKKIQPLYITDETLKQFTR